MLHPAHCLGPLAKITVRAHPDLNQGPADLQSAALTTELCTHWHVHRLVFIGRSYTYWRTEGISGARQGARILKECGGASSARSRVAGRPQKHIHATALASALLCYILAGDSYKHLWSSGYDVSLTR